MAVSFSPGDRLAEPSNATKSGAISSCGFTAMIVFGDNLHRNSICLSSKNSRPLYALRLITSNDKYGAVREIASVDVWCEPCVDAEQRASEASYRKQQRGVAKRKRKSKATHRNLCPSAGASTTTNPRQSSQLGQQFKCMILYCVSEVAKARSQKVRTQRFNRC